MIQFNQLYEDVYDMLLTKLDEETHKYSVNGYAGGYENDYSVTEILNQSTFVNDKMKVAGEVGAKIHKDFATACLHHYYPGELEKISLSPIAYEAYLSVRDFIEDSETEHTFIESPLLARFRMPGDQSKVIHIGGTADLVTLKEIKPGEYELNVFDLKTSTVPSISVNWRIQIAVYLAFYRGHFHNNDIKIVSTKGYVVRPGYKNPILIINDENLNQLLDAFAIKLCAIHSQETDFGCKEKEKLSLIASKLNSITVEEKRVEKILKAAKAEKEKLLNMLSLVVDDIRKANPVCTLKDGDFVVTPVAEVRTSGDLEFLKLRYPAAFCKTVIKNVYELAFNGTKYNLDLARDEEINV